MSKYRYSKRCDFQRKIEAGRTISRKILEGDLEPVDRACFKKTKDEKLLLKILKLEAKCKS